MQLVGQNVLQGPFTSHFVAPLNLESACKGDISKNSTETRPFDGQILPEEQMTTPPTSLTSTMAFSAQSLASIRRQ